MNKKDLIFICPFCNSKTKVNWGEFRRSVREELINEIILMLDKLSDKDKINLKRRIKKYEISKKQDS